MLVDPSERIKIGQSTVEVDFPADSVIGSNPLLNSQTALASDGDHKVLASMPSKTFELAPQQK